MEISGMGKTNETIAPLVHEIARLHRLHTQVALEFDQNAGIILHRSTPKAIQESIDAIMDLAVDAGSMMVAHEH